MGGNAFNGKTLPRIDKDKYQSIIKKISDTLYENNMFNFYPLKQIGEKKDFGDVDILISNEYVNLSKLLVKVLSPDGSEYQHTKNNNVYSLLIDDVQVDFISIDWNKLDTIKVFYDYNDVGNLIGRLSRYNKCKFGPNGLFFDIYTEDKSRKLYEVFLSDDIKDIFKFLDLDFHVYNKGFDTYKEAFDFVLSSSAMNTLYYNSRAYINSKSYRRDKVRKTFNMFLDYIKDVDEVQEAEFIKDNDYKKTMNECLDNINTHFPSVKIFDIYDEQKLNEKISKLNKEKYNGDVVSFITGLSGKELGAFMKYLKDTYITNLNKKGKEIHQLNDVWLYIVIYFSYLKYDFLNK